MRTSTTPDRTFSRYPFHFRRASFVYLHILYHLADDGLSIVVHNGSTLFSGDAEAEKATFANSFSITITLKPWYKCHDEFSYRHLHLLWVFNKNKPGTKGQSYPDQWQRSFCAAQKSRGKSARNGFDNRNIIVETLTNFKETSFAKVFENGISISTNSHADQCGRKRQKRIWTD